MFTIITFVPLYITNNRNEAATYKETIIKCLAVAFGC